MKTLDFFKYLGERIRSYDSLCSAFINNLIKEYKGEISIILFGSRARGDNKPSSDFDFFIIVKNGDLLKHYVRVGKCKPPELPADTIILYLEDVTKKLVRRMLKDAKILYDGLSIKDILKSVRF